MRHRLLILFAVLPCFVECANVFDLSKSIGTGLQNATKKAVDTTKTLGQSTVTNVKNATGAIKDAVITTEDHTFTDYFRGGHKYATVTTEKKTKKIVDCLLVGDREFIGFLVEQAPDVSWSSPIQHLANDLPKIEFVNATTEEMDDFVAKCNALEASNNTIPSAQQIYGKLKKNQKSILKYAVIFPGTKWCGAGDVAKDYFDIGQNGETDKCCRDHDHALESMKRGAERNGLKNDLLYTMTNCDHDHKFNECLVKAGTLHASAVGTTFFNVLKTKCFALRKEAECTKQLVKGISPCTEYKFKEDSEEKWQIFDAENFVPNRSVPEQKINGFLHAAPGLGDVLTLVS